MLNIPCSRLFIRLIVGVFEWIIIFVLIAGDFHMTALIMRASFNPGQTPLYPFKSRYVKSVVLNLLCLQSCLCSLWMRNKVAIFFSKHIFHNNWGFLTWPFLRWPTRYFVRWQTAPWRWPAAPLRHLTFHVVLKKTFEVSEAQPVLVRLGTCPSWQHKTLHGQCG